MSLDGRERKPEGLYKYLDRMKTVLRPRLMSKRQSLTAAIATPAETTAPQSSTPAQAEESNLQQPVMITNYSAVQHERARTLFAKYGVTLEPGDTKSPADLQLTRVTKPIRMRVRRTCHRCETVFGSEKLCINCQHTRCTKCPRYPPARTTEPEPALRKHKLPEPSLPQPRIFCRTPHLKLSGFLDQSLETSPRAGGQNLVHRPVRQRVHRFCHLCNSVFTPGSKDCPSCSHVRCKKCPRDPAKLHKYPDGYPGDVEPPKQRPERTFKKTRRRVHYVCHVCETWYQGSSDDCSNCGQTRCAKSIRIPPKKIKPEPSPEVLKGIEEKLASLMIAESQSQKVETVKEQV